MIDQLLERDGGELDCCFGSALILLQIQKELYLQKFTPSTKCNISKMLFCLHSLHRNKPRYVLENFTSGTIKFLV
jgi:hypothetical protein